MRSTYSPHSQTRSVIVRELRRHTWMMKVNTQEIDGLLDLPLERAGGHELRTDPNGGIEIEFECVRFSYRRGPFGLKDISFSVKPGEFLGIVGESGGGKSTIVDLIMGFYPPDSGTIRANGTDIRELSLQSVRAQIGLVAQDAFAWNYTIRENIRYPNDRADDGSVVHAATAAQLHEFVAQLPNGYDTVVGERGIELSGGERQRLAIARAIEKNPRLLLMDEPTSALDAVTELRFRDALDAARKGRTTIVVAHRLASVMHADRILVLENGEVAEIGTPSELIARKGAFHSLYAAQWIG